MNLGKGCHHLAAVVLLLPVVLVLVGARNMPRLEAPGDLAGATPGESILIDVLANDGVLGEGLVLLQVSPPRHGTALVESGQVRYTATASEGVDRFGYMVRLADGRKALGTVEVRVQALPDGMPLNGLVPAHVGAGATVRLYLGEDMVHETLTRTGGHFTLVAPVDTFIRDTVMSVEVVGHTLSGVPARWYSVVGSTNHFSLGWWGRDNEDHWNLRVGPFSTAHHALLSRVMPLPGGSTQAYTAHLPSVDPMMMLRLATVFTMVAEGEVALPVGLPDAYALITDLAALDALVDALPEGAFEARQAALLADRRLIQHYGPELTDLGADGALLAPGGAGLVTPAGSGVADLSGSFYTLDTPRVSDTIQRVADEGWLRLVMEVGAEVGNISRIAQCTGGGTAAYQASRHWDEETLVGLFRGDDVAYLLRLREVTEIARADTFPTWCVAQLPEPTTISQRLGALMYDWWASNPRREGFEPGRHHLGAATSALDRTPRSGWMDVDSQTADFDGRSVFEPLSWGNGWSLSYILEDKAGGVSYHNAKLMRRAAGAQEWLVTVSTTEGGGYSVFSTPGVNADPDLGVVDFNGVWMNGPTTSSLSLGHPGVTEFLVGVDVAAGTGWQITRWPGNPEPELVKVWLEVGDTTLSAFAYRTSNGEFVGQCPPEDTGCTHWRQRDWQVLRVLHDHFGPGHHLMWVDERVRVAFVNGAWLADLRRVMPYMLTGDPVPDVGEDTEADAAPVVFDMEGLIGADTGRMRH